MSMRNIINIVESQSVTPEARAEILKSWYFKHGVKIGPKAELWRGEDEETGGSGFATYGGGYYFTTNKAYAKQFGTVTKVYRTMLPHNALRFDTHGNFQIWYQTAYKILGYNDARDVSVDYPDMRDFILAIDPTIDGLQIGIGKDAMFVLYMNWDGT